MTRSHATSKISTSSIILKLIILKLICVIYVACSIRAGKFLIGRNQQCQVHASSRLFGNERGLISRTAAGNRAYISISVSLSFFLSYFTFCANSLLLWVFHWRRPYWLESLPVWIKQQFAYTALKQQLLKLFYCYDNILFLEKKDLNKLCTLSNFSPPPPPSQTLIWGIKKKKTIKAPMNKNNWKERR